MRRRPGPGDFVIYLLFGIGVTVATLPLTALAIVGVVDLVQQGAHAVRGWVRP